MKTNLLIYTDGASKGNPGPGGWGVVAVLDDEVFELGGKEQNTTNNRMELKGAIEALKFAKNHTAENVEVYSDSKYVLDGITKWVHAWKKKAWVTATGKAVLNLDLWKELSLLAEGQGVKIQWKYLGGHIGIAGNERADVIASDFALGKKVDLYSGPITDYGIDILNFKFDEAKSALKSNSKSKSNQRAYSYISKVDGKVLIHKTWAECEARVKGKKARFKKSVSPEDEKNIIVEFST